MREGGIFFLKSKVFDPTAPFTLRITLPYRAGDKRLYRTFLSNYQLPDAFVDVDLPFWVTRWQEAPSRQSPSPSSSVAGRRWRSRSGSAWSSTAS